MSYNKSSLYCSQKCSKLAQTKIKERPCKMCGKVFKPRTNKGKYCSIECYRRDMAANIVANAHEVNKNKKYSNNYTPHPKVSKKIKHKCLNCGVDFLSTPSCRRKFCSYECFLKSGGPKRAGEAAVMAKLKYGTKKDANHNEIIKAMRKLCPVYDLSIVGCGCPDGIAWINNGWQLFDIKNLKTGYGRRGLNKRQKQWATECQGGPVYLIHTVSEAIAFARGSFDGIKFFPEDRVSARDYREIVE